MRNFLILFFAVVIVEPSFSDDLGDYDIIILGEVHDNLNSHLQQAGLLREIAPSVVVFEMLDPIAARHANSADRKDIDEIREASRWDQSSWPSFNLYEPVFEALGEAEIVGAGIPSYLVKQAVSSGAFSVFGENGKHFGLHLELPENQQVSRQQLQFEVH